MKGSQSDGKCIGKKSKREERYLRVDQGLGRGGDESEGRSALTAEVKNAIHVGK